MTATDVPFSSASLRERIVQRNWLLVELGVLVTVWYWFIGRWWSGSIVPGGLEYSRSMHSFFFWESWQTCGPCAYWGNLNGGNPALQDAYGSFLHPISLVTTLQLGALAGSAMTVSLAFLMIALTSWWFAYSLQIHMIVRIWFGLASMMGGQMASRLELGNIGLALSLASAWLTIVLFIWCVNRPSLVRVIVLAMSLSATLLAGQGYMQLILISMTPILALYAWQYQLFVLPKRQLVIYGSVMIGLVALITAPLWLNLMQPNLLYFKETADDNRFYQPITRLFANLVLDEYDLTKSDIYNNFAYPWAYSTFIGVSSVVFALAGMYWIHTTNHRVLYLLFAGVATWSALIASGAFVQIVGFIPNEWLNSQVDGLRYLVVANGYLALSFQIMAMFAMHAVLTSSAWWPSFMHRLATRIPMQLIVTFAMSIVLFINLQQLYAFHKSWIDDVDGYNPQHQNIIDVLNNQPHGVVRAPNWLLMPLLANHYKMTDVVIPWQAPMNPLPEPTYMVEMTQPENSELIAVHDENWSIYRNLSPTAAYATVIHADGTATPCISDAIGGDIQVQCRIDQPGELRIAEYMLPGWQVTVNDNLGSFGTASDTRTDTIDFILLPINAGDSTIQLRYEPWFATFGMYAYVGGWVVSILLLVYLLLIKKTPTVG